jgi:hypothetical protein
MPADHMQGKVCSVVVLELIQFWYMEGDSVRYAVID